MRGVHGRLCDLRPLQQRDSDHDKGHDKTSDKQALQAQVPMVQMGSGRHHAGRVVNQPALAHTF